MSTGHHGDEGWSGALEEWMRQRSEQFGLRPGRLHVVRVDNPSGWHANVACTVSDGFSRLHVKLTREHAALRRAFELRDRLSSRYHAPPMLGWIDLGALVGVAMPSIDAGPATERLIPDLLVVIRLLHDDRELVSALPDAPATLQQAFLDLWIARFDGDLNDLESERKVPPFVSDQTFEWMRAETSRLATMASSAAFDAPAVSPVHGDLHFGNVLVEPNGQWWLIDWDDLRRGDPAADLAILLSPLSERGRSVDHFLGPQDGAFLERFALCTRAQILDGAIDSLSDWADAGVMPLSRDWVRTDKRMTHERALRMYRECYGA